MILEVNSPSVNFKKVLRILLGTFFLVLGISGCNKFNTNEIKGYAQGTTYSIKYLGKPDYNLKLSIDSMLSEIDSSLSTYKSFSLVSRVNNTDSVYQIDEHFYAVLSKSLEIYKTSNGSFDPTIKPLIDFWGFGDEKTQEIQYIDSLAILKILEQIGSDKVKIIDNFGKSVDILEKYDSKKEYFFSKPKGIKLDFNAIAQGYSIDVIAAFFLNKGITNFMIELGGEVRANGKNQQNQLWKIGIDKPEMNQNKRALKAILSLDNRSVATSGNYRKYYFTKGKPIFHTLNPKTGFPIYSNPIILSATVVANDCISADGYATAIMSAENMNMALNMINHNSIQAYLVYQDTITKEIKSYLSENLKLSLEEL